MCAGAIDGKHIPVLVSHHSHLKCVNCKYYHCIIMHTVADCTYLFGDVVIGWP